MPAPLSSWIAFTGGVLLLLWLDLVVGKRGRRPASLRESLAATFVWLTLTAAFGLWIIHRSGATKGLEFFTGYLIEYSLSMDNVFIFVLIFASFRIDAARQHRLLFWGVLGALVLRGVMVGAGTALLNRFEWVIYLFGAYILYAGVSMLWQREEIEIEKQWVVRLARRLLPLSAESQPERFMVRESGRLKFTLLALVLVIIEGTDLIFALDSVPAVFGVTRDPFIVYTSNICAVLGLRSLYVLLAGAVKHLVYLHVGLAAVLSFVGAKMLAAHLFPIPTDISLLVVGGILAVTIVASLLNPRPVGPPR